MKKTQPLILLLAAACLVSAALARAESFSEKCSDIASCVKVVSELTGQKYIFDKDVRGNVMATANLDINKDNAEMLFTEMLDINGFARVPSGEPNTYRIARQRDARDLPILSLSADQQTAPELPKTWDLVTLRYHATHPESVEMIARISRSFMPANSRIIPDELGGMLLITDTAFNLRKLYDLIKDMDRKPSPEFKKHWDEIAKARLNNPPQPPQGAGNGAPPAPKPPGESHGG